MDMRLFVALPLIAVFLAAQCILGFVWFQFWLRNLSHYFKPPGWLERLRHDLVFDWRMAVLSGALMSLSCMSASLALLIWTSLWDLALVFTGASLAMGLFSGVGYTFRLRFRR